MVDLVNIARVNQLAGEKQSIIAALELFSRGGRIVGFGMNPPGDDYDGPSPAVSVLSRYMNYPPAMVTSITTMLQARLAEIQQQLTEMGITGLDQVQPRAPGPQFGSGSPPPGMPRSGTPPPPVAPRGPASQFIGPKK